MTKSSSPLLHPKWAQDQVTPMPLVRPPVPLPVLKAGRPHKVLQAVPGLAPAPVTLPALDRATNPGPAVAAAAAELELALATLPVQVPAEEAAPGAVINPAQVQVTLTALAPAISPAVEATKGQLGSE